jgi:hypothetical protein
MGKDQKEIEKLRITKSTLNFLFAQMALLFSSCTEVVHHKEKFNTHVAELDRSITLYQTVTLGLINYYLVIACSFMEEWENELNESRIEGFAREIRKLKRIVKPAVKQIKLWTGLKKFRNIALAHNLRGKDRQSIYHQDSVLDFKIPRSAGDLLLLNMMIGLITSEMNDHFKDVEISVDNNALTRMFLRETDDNDAMETFRNVLKEVASLKSDKV